MIFVSILLAISDAKPVATYLKFVLVFLYVFNVVVHSETIWLEHFAVNDPTTKKQVANETTDSVKLRGEGVDYFAMENQSFQGHSDPTRQAHLVTPKCIWYLDDPCAQTNPKNNWIMFVRLIFLEFFKGKCVFPMVFYDSLRFCLFGSHAPKPNRAS